jgi:hypothetical protein
LVIGRTKAKWLGEILAAVPSCLTTKFTNMRLTRVFVAGSMI